MELTLDQALQKGIEAHKAGKAQEADKYYTAILKAHPKHPDANHNMGLLAVGVSKVEEALPFFKTALDANPGVGQYWLSYISALIKLDRIDNAKAVLDQAKSKGAKGDDFEKVEEQLGLSMETITTEDPTVQEPPEEELQSLINLHSQGKYQELHNQTLQLLEKYSGSITLYNILGAAFRALGDLGKAIGSFNKALSIKPNYVEAYYNMGNALKDQGKLEKAIEAYTKAVSIKPDFAEAFNNMGNALKDQGKPEKAIEAYIKALSIKPDYPDAYTNMGNVLQEEEKLEEALEAYNKAISIKPDYAEAYNNLGKTLKDQENIEEAIEAFTKAVAIKPDYAEAHNNMGIALKDQGKLEEAIEALTKAILIKPDYAEVWNSLYFPLQAMKSKNNSDQNLNLFYPKGINSNYGKIQLDVLDYRLYRGQEDEWIYLDKALESLSSAENISIKNPTFDENAQEQIQPLPDKMVALVHFGRSGTGLMHSLVDGHPEISTLPSIYFSEYFDHSTWLRITSAGWDRIIDRFIAIYEVLFDASSSVPIESKSKKLQKNIGIKEGMANVGEQKNEIVKVNKFLFREELMRLMAYYNDLDASLFFKLIHNAYNVAVNDKNSKNLIFYHIHNPSTYAQLNFARLNPNVKWFMMVREPIQSLESWANRKKEKNSYSKISTNILSMLFAINNPIYKGQGSLGLRLEDVKKQPENTIKALCKWMGIKESESLYEMTAQGKKWWGDPTSPDYSKDGMEPFGKSSINRRVGSIFSKNDQFILHTLFYPFSARFGYTEKNQEKFLVDLKKIRPMLDELFDFEKKIAEQVQMSCENLKASGSYLYLRSGLIERWNTLNEFHTYPNMIKPIKI